MTTTKNKIWVLLPRIPVLVSLLLAGCETVSDRIREKSVIYESLTPMEKTQILNGVVQKGFDSDMVYMALGKPSKLEQKDSADARIEIWTYNNYYPPGGRHKGYAQFTKEQPYQRSAVVAGTNRPVGMGDPESISTTGGPQGGSTEPADLLSYTLIVLFKNGKVAEVGVK